MRSAAACIAAALLVAGCGDSGGSSEMRLVSPAFEDGDQLPSRFTCDGEGSSPPIGWSGVPEDAQDLALIVEDADVPVSAFVHWTAWSLPFADGGEGALPEGELAPGADEGISDLGSPGWAPPCPPEEDGAHRYVFTLHALEAPLDLPKDATAAAVRSALVADSIAEAKLEATYDAR